jgi:hypothetical protein
MRAAAALFDSSSMTRHLPDTPLALAAARNKSHYLQAKEAFNRGDLAACVAFYGPDHQIRSRPGPPGRAVQTAVSRRR